LVITIFIDQIHFNFVEDSKLLNMYLFPYIFFFDKYLTFYLVRKNVLHIINSFTMI